MSKLKKVTLPVQFKPEFQLERTVLLARVVEKSADKLAEPGNRFRANRGSRPASVELLRGLPSNPQGGAGLWKSIP